MLPCAANGCAMTARDLIKITAWASVVAVLLTLVFGEPTDVQVHRCLGLGVFALAGLIEVRR